MEAGPVTGGHTERIANEEPVVNRRPISLFIAASLLGGGWYLSAQAERSDSPTSSTNTLRRVRVSIAEPVEATRALRFSGVTRAQNRAHLSFAAGGKLTARPVEAGDRVQAGQVIAELDQRALRNAVDTARATRLELAARRTQADRDRARVASLVAAKAATDEELEQLDARIEALVAADDAAAARLREQERRLAEARLIAPFAGTVTEVLFEPGEYAGTGRAVVVLAGAGAVEVEVEVPESVVGRIAPNDAVTINFPALGRRDVAGTVTSVAQTTAGPGRLFPVVVRIDEDTLTAGRTAEVMLSLRADSALAVPVDAIVNPGGSRPVLFRVQDQNGTTTVNRVSIAVGQLVGDRVTVEGALEAGDRVVVGGQRGLLDGESVEVAP